MEKNNKWKTIGIIFIILFILSIVFSVLLLIGFATLAGMGIGSYYEECSNLCEDSETSSFDFMSGECYCYSGCELIVKEKIA